jgi:hypothetical protein
MVLMKTISLKFNRLFAETECSYTQLRHFGHFASQEIATSEPVAQRSALATNNRLVGSSPRSPAQTEISRFSANSPELRAVNRIFVQIVEFSAATGTEPFGTQFGFRHGPILRAIGGFTWLVARRLSIVDPLRLSLEKAIGNS